MLREAAGAGSIRSTTTSRALILVLITLVAIAVPVTASIAQSGAASPRAEDRDLARRILEDKRMDSVVVMGHELLKSGMNADGGYTEVWIRDLNTFIVPLLDASPPRTVREALSVFFHFQGEDGNIVDGYVPASKAHVNDKYRSSPSQPKLKAHKNTVETDQESSLVRSMQSLVGFLPRRQSLSEMTRARAQAGHSF